jgi:hypothetical protein
MFRIGLSLFAAVVLLKGAARAEEPLKLSPGAVWKGVQRIQAQQLFKLDAELSLKEYDGKTFNAEYWVTEPEPSNVKRGLLLVGTVNGTKLRLGNGNQSHWAGHDLLDATWSGLLKDDGKRIDLRLVHQGGAVRTFEGTADLPASSSTGKP